MASLVLLLTLLIAGTAYPTLSRAGEQEAQAAADEAERLDRELRAVENEATAIGRAPTIREGLVNVRARRAELAVHMSRLEESMERLGATADEIDAVRREMDAQWVFTPSDAGEESVEMVAERFVEQFLGKVGRRVLGAITMVADVVEYGGKKYIKSVNVQALEELVRQEELNQDLLYAAYRALDIEARMQRINEQRLGELQARWSALMEEAALARRRAEVHGGSAGDRAVTDRETDAAGDARLEREAAFDDPSPRQAGWYTTAREHRGEIGRAFSYHCPPFEGGHAGVWGTDLYSDDSSICAAAVHVGLITKTAGGRVIIQLRAPPERFLGSSRNGVSSSDYFSSAGYSSFAVVGH